MVRRHKKKKGKLLGKRSHGRGKSKRGRGKGSRMGRGSVKIGKRNFMHIVKFEPERLPQAKKGFYSWKTQPRTINLRGIERLSDKNEIDVTEFGFDKVLGGGEITRPLKIKARFFSKKAKEKIEKAGGEIILIGKGE